MRRDPQYEPGPRVMLAMAGVMLACALGAMLMLVRACAVASMR